ncbi:unnamed protein product [Urochloa humidicola]
MQATIVLYGLKYPLQLLLYSSLTCGSTRHLLPHPLLQFISSPTIPSRTGHGGQARAASQLAMVEPVELAARRPRRAAASPGSHGGRHGSLCAGYGGRRRFPQPAMADVVELGPPAMEGGRASPSSHSQSYGSLPAGHGGRRRFPQPAMADVVELLVARPPALVAGAPVRWSRRVRATT